MLEFTIIKIEEHLKVYFYGRIVNSTLFAGKLKMQKVYPELPTDVGLINTETKHKCITPLVNIVMNLTTDAKKAWTQYFV